MIWSEPEFILFCLSLTYLFEKTDFDRGLISIDDNYTVLVNSNFSEVNRTPYNIKQFDGMRLLLPENNKLFPSLDSLKHHRTRFGF